MLPRSASGDDELLALQQKDRKLNRRHGLAASGDRFLLLHRRRQWNAGEAKWIGWERKRGKLHELDRWLRGDTDTSFVFNEGHPTSAPSGVRYVITLDSDTRLPLGVARRLIGKIAHPLNRPSYDCRVGRVVEGHAILQPRITPALPLMGARSSSRHSQDRAASTRTRLPSRRLPGPVRRGSYTGRASMTWMRSSRRWKGSAGLRSSAMTCSGIFARADWSRTSTRRGLPSAIRRRGHASIAGRAGINALPWILSRGRDDRATVAGFRSVDQALVLDNLRRTYSRGCRCSCSRGLGPGRQSGTGGVRAALAGIVIPMVLPLMARLMPPRRVGAGAGLGGREVGGAQMFLTVTLLAHRAW